MQIPIKMQRLGSKIIELHKISKSFDQKKIIENFSYNFLKKERLGIVGKNGAGKSTILNMIMNDVNVDSGKIVIEYKDLEQFDFISDLLTKH